MSGTPFTLCGVVHLVRPWGSPAADLEQLRRGLAEAPDGVLFRHAVQHVLRYPAADELPPDDLSAWIGGVVQDAETAERVSFVVQGAHDSPGELRRALLEVLESVPESRRLAHDAPPDGAFGFLSAAPMVFPMGVDVRTSQELVEALVALEPGVWFHHLIEEPWWSGGRAPLLEWLESRSDTRLASWLREGAASGLPIDSARARLHRRWRQSQIGRRLVEAAHVPEAERLAAGRDAVARLVRRRPAGGGT